VQQLAFRKTCGETSLCANPHAGEFRVYLRGTHNFIVAVVRVGDGYWSWSSRLSSKQNAPDSCARHSLDLLAGAATLIHLAPFLVGWPRYAFSEILKARKKVRDGESLDIHDTS
jgi:hypothetical protein